MNDMEREAYRAKAEAKIDEWTAKINELEAKARQSSADAAVGLNESADKLRERVKEMRARMAEEGEGYRDEMDRLFKSAEATWESVKDRMSGKE